MAKTKTARKTSGATATRRRRTNEHGSKPAKGGDRPLTPKQARWLGFYLVLGNATLAAKQAGYSEKTARQQGARMLSNVVIQAAMQRDLDHAEITRVQLLRQQKANAFADRAACYDSTTRQMLPMDQWPEEARMSLEGYEVVTTNVTAGDGHQDTVIKPKWLPRNQAAELIGKRIDVAAFKEDVLRHSGTIRIIHELDGASSVSGDGEDGA